ncbi:MAG: aspartate aminotransferase family protein [Hyphomicrobiaceae bacterium]
MASAAAATELAPNASLDDALIAARASYGAKNPKSAGLQSEAARFLPGGNTRTTLFHGPFPLRFVKGEGCTLTDADGHAYTNFISEYTAGMFGHSHPVIRRAIMQALDFGINIGGHTELESKFAAAVTARFPSLERVRFTNSGTEGNLMNVALARHYTKRKKILVFAGGYHGGVLYFRKGGSPVNAPFEAIVAPYNDLEKTEALIRANAKDLACILIEPMFGSTGCIQAERPFLAGLRQLATETGALLIFDEVMTSRLAPGGLQGVHGIKPDLTTLGKYVGGGMSFGAFGGRADIMSLFDPARPDALPHAGTFNNNVITMSTGYAALTEIITPEASVAVNARGDKLRERLNAIAKAGGAKMQFTGRGSMMATHFCEGPIRNETDADRGNQALLELFYFDLLDRGIYIARRGMIVLSLAHDEPAFAKLKAAVEDFVRLRRRYLTA